MFDRMTIEAARVEHARMIAEATAHGVQLPAKPTWRARLAARLRRPARLGTVHALPATPVPQAAPKAGGRAA